MLLVVKNLSKQYLIERGILGNKKTTIDALNNINFELKQGTALGVLGETGSGKTTLAKLIVKLIEPTKGEINYNFDNIRRSIQMVFQNPFSSLNPRMKIKSILREPFLIHRFAGCEDVDSKIKLLLEKVNLDHDCLYRYPGEFSGGQRQRIAIARAIAIEPKILVCDEPTSSLDLSVQAQILNLFTKLKNELKLSYVFITHNIEVISFIADEILILYDGRQVERGMKEKVLDSPRHPYTKILLGVDTYELEKTQIDINFRGCRFYSNCKFRTSFCLKSEPSETKIEEEHYVSCHLFR